MVTSIHSVKTAGQILKIHSSNAGHPLCGESKLIWLYFRQGKKNHHHLLEQTLDSHVGWPHLLLRAVHRGTDILILNT